MTTLSCTAPPPPSPGTIHPSAHFSTFHGFHSRPQLFTHLPTLLHPSPVPSPPTSSHTYCSGLPCRLHGLWTPLSLPCLLQNLHFPWGPLLPHPFRLQLSPDSPPGGPLRACCLCSCCLFILCTFLFPVGLSLGGTEPRQLPGEQERARKQEHTRREKRARWSGGRWGQGPGKAGVCGGWGKQGPGQGVMETGGWGRGGGGGMLEGGACADLVGNARGWG